VKKIGPREIIVRIYDNVHAALWAGLLAFVAYFIVIVAPKIPEAAATAAEAQGCPSSYLD